MTSASEGAERTTIQLSDGSFGQYESWVYVWMRPDGEVVHVGATGLPLVVRTWLHVNDERPEVGRLRADRPDALEGDIDVHGFALGPDLDRARVRSLLESLLRGDDLDSADPDDAELLEAIAIRRRLRPESAP